MKRLIAFTFALLVAINIMLLPAHAEGLEPELVGDNCIAIMNGDNGQLVYSHRGEEIIAPACSAKLCALMVVWDMFDKYGVPLNTVISVPREATLAMYIGETDISAPSLGLKMGEQYTAEDLMAATLVSNSNDSCYTLCHYVATELMGGSMLDFVGEMNKKAAAAGATNTVYQNCVGLNSAEAHTTACDTAAVATAFYKYNTMVEMSAQPTFRMDGGTIHTKNYLLSSRLLVGYQTSAAKGMIAGQATNNGGYCLISTTESKDGIPFVLVVMNAPGEIREDGVRSFPEGNAYQDMLSLIPWANSSFSYHELVSDGEMVAELKVSMGKTFDHVQVVAKNKLELLINNEIDPSMIQRHVEFDEKVYEGDYNGTNAKMIDAPVLKGDPIGRVVYTYGGEVMGSVELVAAATVESNGLLSAISAVREFLFSDLMLTLLKWIAIIVAAAVVYWIVSFVVRTVASARETKPENDEEDEEDGEEEQKEAEKSKKKRKKSK